MCQLTFKLANVIRKYYLVTSVFVLQLLLNTKMQKKKKTKTHILAAVKQEIPIQFTDSEPAVSDFLSRLSIFDLCLDFLYALFKE